MDFKINSNNIGKRILCIYIFMCYNALDIIIPSVANTILLYCFLGYGLLMGIFNEKKGKIRITKYNQWYALFMIISVITMLYSPDGINIFVGKFYQMIVIFMITFFAQFYIRVKKDLIDLAWAFSVSSFVLISTLLLTGRLIGTVENRLGSDLMGNANTFAYMIMIAVFFQGWLVLHVEEKVCKKTILYIMLIFNMLALALSAGRKFFIIPFIYIYILLLLKKDRRGKIHFVKYTIICLVLIVGIYNLIMSVPILYDAIGYRMEVMFDTMNGGKISNGNSISVRHAMKSLAIQGWLESPIWGYGFDSFKYLALEKLGELWYSHCNYVELLYNGGVLYFISYYYIYIYMIVVLLKKKTINNEYKAFMISSMISLLVFDYVSVSYEITFIQLIIALIVYIPLIDENDKKNKMIDTHIK